MLANFKVSPKLTVQIDAETASELHASLAEVQEVFSYDKCGKCQDPDIRYTHRLDDEENHYYEIKCQKCGARLQLGSLKKPKGGLFAKVRWNSLSEGDQARRQDEKAYADKHFGLLPDGGWSKPVYVKKEE